MPRAFVYRMGICIWGLACPRIFRLLQLPRGLRAVVVDRWILDTGSGHDLVDERQVSGISATQYRKAHATLQAAGGRMGSAMQVVELGEGIAPWCSNPRLLS